MYLNLVIPLSYGDEGCYLIVTEATWIPEEKRFDIETGYVVEGYNFLDVYNTHYNRIQEVMKKWWEDDKYQNTDWEGMER